MDYIDPDKARFGLFKDLPRDHPIDMLNLVKLHDQAQYEDGRKATGREAYSAYGKESGPVLKALGIKIIWSGEFQLTLIGPQEEQWDIAFIARYPSGQAFIEMIRNDDYRKAVIHRQAAVETSRLIRMKVKKSGNEFG